MSKTNLCTIIIVLVFCTFKINAQSFLNLDAKNSLKKEYLLSKINKALLSTNSIYFNNNQVYYGKNSTVIELDYNEMTSISDLSQKSKSEIEIAIIKINSDENSFDFSNLNQLVKLEVIYLIMELKITENELVKKLVNNSNFPIVYKISIPE